MKKFLYLGIFLLLISCNSYAAIRDVELVDDDPTKVMTMKVTADPEDAGKNIEVRDEIVGYMFEGKSPLVLSENGEYSYYIFEFRNDFIYTEDRYIYVTLFDGNNVSEFMKNLTIPFGSSFINDPRLEGYTYPGGFGINLSVDFYDVTSEKVQIELYGYSLGYIGMQEAYLEYYSDNDAYISFYFDTSFDAYSCIIDTYTINIFVDGRLVEVREQSLDYYDYEPYVECIIEEINNENQKMITYNIDWFGGAGIPEYCITSSPKLTGEEEWMDFFSACANFQTDYYQTGSFSVVVQPRDGQKFIHLKITNPVIGGEWYRVDDITRYKLWTGSENSSSSDNCSVTYANGKITVTGKIYSNVAGKFRLKAYNQYLNFTLEGDAKNISYSYEPDGDCCAQEYDKDSPDHYNNANLLDGEYGECTDYGTGGASWVFDATCNHIEKGWVYAFTFEIDVEKAKKAGLSEGALASINFEIQKYNEVYYIYETVKNFTLDTAITVDWTAPTITIDKNGSAAFISNPEILITVQDAGAGLKVGSYYAENISYQWVNKDVPESNIKFNTSTRLYQEKECENLLKKADAGIGYAKISFTPPEDEIMQYCLWIKASDNVGNTKIFKSNSFNCGQFTLNLTYKNESNNNEVIYEKTIKTNIVDYVINVPYVETFDVGLLNRSEKDIYGKATYSNGTNALSKIEGDSFKLKSFSDSQLVINAILYYKEVAYTLKDIEEGISLTHPENYTHQEGTYSTEDLRFNDLYPIGFYKGRYYWGFQYDCIPYYNNGYYIFGRLAGLAYYDINTEAMKFVKLPYSYSEAVYSERKNMSLTSKLITDNYSYTKALEISEKRTILLENGMIYYLQRPFLSGDYRYDDSREKYFPKKFKMKKVLPDVKIGPRITKNGYYSSSPYYVTGITDANWLIGWSDVEYSYFADNVKNASMLDTDLVSNIAVLQLDGKLYRFTTDYRKDDYYQEEYDIAENVVELNGLYFVKDIGNNQWTICKLSDEGTSYTEMLTLAANSFSLEDLDGTYLQVGTNVYNLTSKSAARSPKYTDVKDYVSGYILKTN